jgi:ribosomal protein S18 acetylase RimI-like enzyme
MLPCMNVKTYYLQMCDPARLMAKPRPHAEFTVRECEIPQYEVNRFLYRYVGAAWHWTDRDEWSDERWRSIVESDRLRTWVAYDRGTPAGYFELQKQAGDEVEILYFGLAEAFIGKGYGGYVLTRAIEEGWSWGAQRVWLHTCTLDHPSALANYRARGFEVYEEREEQVF